MDEVDTCCFELACLFSDTRALGQHGPLAVISERLFWWALKQLNLNNRYLKMQLI